MEKIRDTEAFGMLRKAGVPVTDYALAKTGNDAIRLAGKIGYPVAIKVSSRDIVHKTESGGIALGLKNEKEVADGYKKIISAARRKYPKAKIDGVMVQGMASGVELIIGSKIDQQFGPVVLFGLGGVFVEVMKDVTFRLVPIEREDAREMIREIKGYKILSGVRGQKPVNMEALEDCLLKVSRMVSRNPRIKELDINPLFANSRGVVAADVRILI